MAFRFLKDMRIGDALALATYSPGAHSGTHIDAPMHFVRGGASVDRVPLEAVRGGDYDLIVLPIKVRGPEGAPARAVLRRRAP
jgi:kynurenine formamidase